MPKLEDFAHDENNEKKSAKKESTEKKNDIHSYAENVMEQYRDLIKKFPNDTYSKKQTNGAVLDVYIHGNDIQLSEHYAGEIKVLFQWQLDTNVFNVTLKGKWSATYNRGDKKYSGSMEGIKAVKDALIQCKEILQYAAPKKQTAAVEQEFDSKLDQAYS